MYTNSLNVQQKEEVSNMKYRMQVTLAVFASIMIALPFRADAQATDAEILKRLKVIIEQQQKQLEAQQQAITALTQKVDALTQRQAPTAAPPEAAPVSGAITPRVLWTFHTSLRPHLLFNPPRSYRGRCAP